MGNASSHTQPSDRRFIQDCSVTLFLKQQVLDEAIRTVQQVGYTVCHIDCGDDEKMTNDLGYALLWEQHFGYFPDHLNLDALNDAFRYFPNAQSPKLAVVFDRFPDFWKRSPEIARKVLDIVEYQSRERLLDGCRLIAFVKTDDPNLNIEGLAARAAGWNPQEWLNESRGV